MQHRRTAGLVAVALLTLAACGSGSDDAATPTTDGQAVPTDPPATGDFSDSETEATSESEVEPTDESEPVATEAVAEDTEAPADTEPTVEDTVAEPAVDDAPEPEQTPEPVVGGRLFAEAIQPAAQFDGNPFPDLVVDDIGKDARVNVANILPSDRPVLLWAWAPH